MRLSIVKGELLCAAQDFDEMGGFLIFIFMVGWEVGSVSMLLEEFEQGG